jgi:hypothetical protein
MTRRALAGSSSFVFVAIACLAGCSSSGGKHDGGADAAGAGGGAGNGGGAGTDAAPGDAPDGAAGEDGGLPDAPQERLPPTMLTAAVLSRREVSFQLRWPAPTGNQGGYDVRFSRVPITAANFDDTAVAQAVPFTGTPVAPGQAESLVIHNLNIEQDYYFAVVGKTSTGTRGTIMTTTTAVSAQFLTTTLSGTGMDGVGVDVDGTGDFGRASDRAFTADNFSDLVVGTVGSTHAYIYFGSAAGYSNTPSVTITGTATGFGQAVVNAGDLDGDGLDDIAVASPADGAGKVFIFSRKNPPASWGSTTTWPATLTDAQANYVLTADATFTSANSIPRRGLARLGNFDGTGSDDLAIECEIHGGTTGSLLIVKGSSAFASATIPGAGTIEIDGTITGGVFGYPVVGIGPFFAGAGPGLVTAAQIGGAVYAFRGQAPAGILTAANADDSVIGPVADRYGGTLGFIGAVGSSLGAVAAATTTGKYVDVHLGTAATGPLLGPAGGAPAPSVHFVDAASGNAFGVITLGGGVKGTSRVVSLIGGDALPDLVLAGQGEANNPVYIVNGAALSTLTGTVDVSAVQSTIVTPIVKASGRIPNPWGGYAGATVIPDSNSDGFADFAIGENGFQAAGRVVVFY